MWRAEATAGNSDAATRVIIYNGERSEIVIGQIGAAGWQVDEDAGLAVDNTLNLTRLSYSGDLRRFSFAV